MSLSQLSTDLLLEKPQLLPEFPSLEALPEKVIQFGTGVLLRGLPDYFIDKANKKGLFNGRIVVVKSTSRGGTDAFSTQSNLFTHTIRGIENGNQVQEDLINASISRTLSASENWQEIMTLAASPTIQVIISNTTEVGIQYIEDDLTAQPPVSFPGKLTAFLYERFQKLGGAPDSGLVIVPTELIVGNGDKLRAIIAQQIERHDLPDDFQAWVNQNNTFCNSLVDRIVPGKPDQETTDQLVASQGYTDDLQIISEVYRLWAIEGGENLKSVLSFAQADPGVIIEPDIDIYRELKLRLLNGTHTLAVGHCFLSGENTVRESMENPELEKFISDLMLKELAVGIPYELDAERAEKFGKEVLDRFRNPFIRHNLIDITVQYTAKMKMRNIPTLVNYYQKTGQIPTLFAKGFASFLLFMKATELKDGQYYGARNGEAYPIRCDSAAYFAEKWDTLGHDVPELVNTILKDSALWGADLSNLNGFAEAVLQNLAVEAN